MTTTDTRPAAKPQVIDGEYTVVTPPANPHRFALIASSVILLGTAGAALLTYDGSDLERGGTAFALFIALSIWVANLIRFNARAEAGDR